MTSMSLVPSLIAFLSSMAVATCLRSAGNTITSSCSSSSSELGRPGVGGGLRRGGSIAPVGGSAGGGGGGRGRGDGSKLDVV